MEILHLSILAGTLTNVMLIVLLASRINSALQPVTLLHGALNRLTLEVDRLAERIALTNVVGDRASELVTSAAKSETAGFVKDSVGRLFERWKAEVKGGRSEI